MVKLFYISMERRLFQLKKGYLIINFVTNNINISYDISNSSRKCALCSLSKLKSGIRNPVLPCGWLVSGGPKTN